MLEDRRGYKDRLLDVFTLHAPKVLLGVLFAFPLGVLVALADAVSLFASVLPISIFLGLVCPIVVPLIVFAGALLASWLVACAALRRLIAAGALLRNFVLLAIARARASCTLHVLLHVHYVAYMGIYGILVLVDVDPPPPAAPARRRPHLFMDMPPKTAQLLACLPTPPYSSPSYTPPSCSPALTKSVPWPPTPTAELEEPTPGPLPQLWKILHTLADGELEVVSEYVSLLKKGRTRELG